MRSRFSLALALLGLLIIGCGGPHAQADLDRARAALETALDAWKRGEGPDKLRARPEPIEFSDDDQKVGCRLLDYAIEGSRHTDKEAIRYTVRLSLQNRRGKTFEHTTTYGVALRTPIAIGRDPYF